MYEFSYDTNDLGRPNRLDELLNTDQNVNIQGEYGESHDSRSSQRELFNELNNLPLLNASIKAEFLFDTVKMEYNLGDIKCGASYTSNNVDKLLDFVEKFIKTEEDPSNDLKIFYEAFAEFRKDTVKVPEEPKDVKEAEVIDDHPNVKDLEKEEVYDYSNISKLEDYLTNFKKAISSKLIANGYLSAEEISKVSIEINDNEVIIKVGIGDRILNLRELNLDD